MQIILKGPPGGHGRLFLLSWIAIDRHGLGAMVSLSSRLMDRCASTSKTRVSEDSQVANISKVTAAVDAGFASFRWMGSQW